MITSEHDNKLKLLLEYAIGNVAFYRDLSSLKIGDLSGTELLKRFPILNKRDINENKERFFSDYAKSLTAGRDLFTMKEYLIPESTSGSSGFPIISYKSRAERAQLAFDLWKRRKFYDERVNQQNMFCLIHTHSSQKRIVEDTRNIHPEAIEKVLAYLLNDYKPLLLHSTPSDLEKYGQYILDNQIDLGDWQPAFVESNSELLSADQKELIAHAFRTKVVNSYGSREVWNIAYECPEGNMHLSDNVHLEVVDLNENRLIEVDSSEYGEIVVTSLVLRDYPFIRYRMGDIGRLRTTACSCGLKNHILELFEARKINLIHQIHGKIKITNGVSLFKGVIWDMLSKGYSGVERYKIIQTSPIDFEAYLVLKDDLSEAFVEHFRLFARKRLEQDANIKIIQVDPRHPVFVGKSYSFISRIN